MKFTVATALSLLGAAAASPAPPATFEVMSLRTGSPIHFSRVSAASGGLFLNFPKQNAACKGKSDGYATFYIQDEELYLYSTCGAEDRQRVFTDRSGMGQGVIRYVTGNGQGSRYAEFQGWQVDGEGNLTFKGLSLLACPNGLDGGWSIWVSGVTSGQPGGNQGCLGFTARTTPNTKPVSCKYT